MMQAKKGITNRFVPILLPFKPSSSSSSSPFSSLSVSMAVFSLQLNFKIVTMLLLFNLLCSDFSHLQLCSALGINYGQVADNLPSPEQVRGLLTSLRISKIRIYDANPRVLAAFVGTGIELIVTVPNDAVALLADPRRALQWLTTNVRPFVPTTRITGIAVGNEVFTGDNPALMSNLVPAMLALHSALAELGLDASIHVSTANSLAVLATSYPPSMGAFKPELSGLMLPFLQFLEATGAPFWVNAYPYFAYKDDPEAVSLDYVLANPNSGTVDPYTGLRYDNMLYAQVDAVAMAAARMGCGGVDVRVSETGWPSKGDADEVGATVENARAYNRNLLGQQMRGEGTPLRPEQRLEVYLFALFNEDMKPGPTSERNYGLFEPNGSMVYNVGLVGPRSSASISLTSSASKEKFGETMSHLSLVSSMSSMNQLLEGLQLANTQRRRHFATWIASHF